MAVGGLFAPFTGGASLGIFEAGCTVTASGMAAVGGAYLGHLISGSLEKDIKNIRKEYEEISNEMFKSLQKIEKQITELWESNNLKGQSGGIVHIFADIVWKLARLTVIRIEKGVDFSARSDKGYIGKIRQLGNLLYQLDHTPIDFIKESLSNIEKTLFERMKHSQAKAIKEWLNQDLPNEKQITDILMDLQKIFARFTEDLKKKSEGHQTVECLKKALEKTLVDVEGTIIHEIPEKLDFFEKEGDSKIDAGPSSRKKDPSPPLLS